MTKNGISYEIKNGLTSSFLQTLMNVELQQLTAPSSSSSSLSVGDNPHLPSSSSSSLSSEKKKKSSHEKTGTTSSTIPALTSTEIRGNIHFMGNITKKLVITPSYELGVKRKKGIPSGSSSSPSSSSSSTKKGSIQATDQHNNMMNGNSDGIANNDEVDFSESLMMEIDGES
jgi:hypothetical protein